MTPAPAMQLIQVVPRLGPWDGVGDYASTLGGALERRHGIASRFVEAAAPTGRAAVAAALGEGAGPVLLHYVGYGYAKRGAPLWLARCVERRRPQRRLAVVFHELYATGRPWQSAFWLSGLQKLVARRLAQACDGALLTRSANRAWLDASGALAGKRAQTLPISSNVGEPREVRAASARPARMVVWGSAAARAQVYGRDWPGVLGACRALGVSGLVDIGPPVTLPEGSGVSIDARGRLDAQALSQVLLDARFGLLAYPAAFLAKSSVFAAYAAHGMVPVVLDDSGTPDMDGLAAGESYVRLGQPAPRATDDVARRARDWYARHDTVAHADAVLRLIEPHA